MTNKINSMVIRVIQDEINILLTKMTVQDLIENTYADIYDPGHEDGYQRPLNHTQVANIYEYLKTEQHSILPTSMILAIKKDDIIVSDDSLSFELKDKLRIVDGQHRIAAMKKLIEDYKEEMKDEPDLVAEYENFCALEYPVNIMLLDKEQTVDHFVEIRSFVDINKKGKKVTTDLAYSIMQNIRKNFKALPAKIAYQQISSDVVKILNSDVKSAWYQCIRAGDEASSDRSIGISSFNLSINNIIKKYILQNYNKKQEYDMSIINHASKKIAEVLQSYWEAIGDKWEDAFFWDEEYKSYRIDPNYNIQKSLGVFPLHKILNIYFTNDIGIDEALEKAKNALSNSRVTSENWIIGGSFSSYTSSSGHTKIKNIILGLE